MLTSVTSVIERRLPITDRHTTHPYEVGWASEAIFFVQTEGPHPVLSIQPEISPDGLAWLPADDTVQLAPDQQIQAVRLSRFGGWLRLNIAGAKHHEPATVLIHLALKG